MAVAVLAVSSEFRNSNKRPFDLCLAGKT